MFFLQGKSLKIKHFSNNLTTLFSKNKIFPILVWREVSFLTEFKREMLLMREVEY